MASSDGGVRAELRHATGHSETAPRMGFADDTAVHDEGDGRFTAEIRDGWDLSLIHI